MFIHQRYICDNKPQQETLFGCGMCVGNALIGAVHQPVQGVSKRLEKNAASLAVLIAILTHV